MNAAHKKLSAGLILAAWALACASGSWAEQKKTPKRGEPAPALSIEQWLEPEGAKVSGWSDLQGQVVVVEFWATWCAPCVAAIPHLNQLAEKFEGLGVRFISVSDEDEATVKKFLMKKPIRGWLALDPDKSTFKSYGVRGIPLTAVVGRDGTLIARTDPQDLTETALEEILAGKVTEAQSKLAEPHAPEEISLSRAEDSADALFEVFIRPGEPKGMARMSPNQIVFVGMELKGILASCYQIPQNRMALPEELGNTTYDVQVTVPPQKKDSLWPTLRQALEAALDLHMHKEKREMQALVLVVPNGETPKLSPAELSDHTSWRSGEGEMWGSGVSLADLARSLEFVTKQPVVDETGLEGRYDIELNWEKDNPEAIFTALRQQLGLELRKAKRPIEFTVFEVGASAGKPGTQ